jgi:hypothetical protein
MEKTYEISCINLTIIVRDSQKNAVQDCIAELVIHGSLKFGPWDMGSDGQVSKKLYGTNVPCHIYVKNEKLQFHVQQTFKSITENLTVVFVLDRNCIISEI